MPASAKGSFVYVSNYADGTISQFRVKPGGTLTALNPPSVKAYPRCHRLVTDPTGRYLYALSSLQFSRHNCLISQFRIGWTGRLTPLSTPHVSLPDNQGLAPDVISIDPSGPFLYVMNYGGTISQFRIRKNGSLTPLSPPLVSGLMLGSVYSAYSVAFDRWHSVFYASRQTRMTNEILGGFRAFRAGPHGTLHSIMLHIPDGGSLAVGNYAPFPPQQIILSERRRSVYVLYQGFARMAKSEFSPAANLEAVFAQYWIQADGSLRPLKPTTVLFPGTPQEAFIDPHSHYCYVIILPQYQDGYPIETNKVILTRYPIHRNGTLGRAIQQTFVAPAGLFGPVFDSPGHTLYLLTRKGIRLFRIKPNGAVVSLTAQSIRAGRGPLEMIYVQN